jgi:hypothetical protein
LAILLTLPLIPLGIYSIFPHPFMIRIAPLQFCWPFTCFRGAVCAALKQASWSSWLWPLLAGAALVVPLFVKQNTGLALIVSAIPALVLLIAVQIARRDSSRPYLLTITGAALAFGWECC